MELGDFQTPEPLARAVCQVLWRWGVRPRTIVEPSCGRGALLAAAVDRFPTTERAIGLDLQAAHLRAARSCLAGRPGGPRVELRKADCFAIDWRRCLAGAAEPVLVLGNPPWVTSAALSVLGSGNRPARAPRPGLRGIEAVTGKSNFDVSQWLLETLLEALDGREATLAMLCKRHAGRAVLRAAWRAGRQLRGAALYEIDAGRQFGAAVTAGLLVCRLRPGRPRRDCGVYPALDASRASHRLGWEDGRLVHDRPTYRRRRRLAGPEGLPWRSGVKHDCACVLELERRDGAYWNVGGERVAVEAGSVYPFLKGTRLARGLTEPARWLVVPQQRVGQATEPLQRTAPRTWRYLTAHAGLLDRRGSAVYRRQPRFALFGIGDYSFAAWKVAVAGFSKRLAFHKVGPWEGQPVLLDDTCYFVACQAEAEADELARLLQLPAVQEFFAAQIFWEAKRPITAEILRTLDLQRLRSELAGGPVAGRGTGGGGGPSPVGLNGAGA